MDVDETGGLEQGLRAFSDCLATPGITGATSLAHGVFTVPDREHVSQENRESRADESR